MEHNFKMPAITAGMTKTNILFGADMFIKDVFETGNILHAVENIALLEAFIKYVKSNDEFKSYALEEISKHGKEFKSKSGAKITSMESGIFYTYDLCNDIELEELLAQQEAIEITITKRKELLKKLPSSGMEIIKGDEVIRVFPPFKTSTSTYKVTLGK